MNILQCGLALGMCLLTNADYKRDAGFTGIGSQYKQNAGFTGIGSQYKQNAGFTGIGSQYHGYREVPNVAFSLTPTGYGKGSNGHKGLVNFAPNFGAHQGYGIFNEGIHNNLFTPVLVQPIKTVAFDNGWKGVEAGHGSIKEGHAIANAAFGDAHHRSVIPVHEHTNDIAPITPTPIKIHSGFGGFQAPNFGSIRVGQNKGYALPFNGGTTNYIHDIHPFAAPQLQNLNTFNVKQPQFIHIKPQNQNYNNDLNFQSEYKSTRSSGHFRSNNGPSGSFGSKHSPPNSNHNHYVPQYKNEQESQNFAALNGPSNHKYVTPTPHQSQEQPSHSTNTFADGHGTNGHGGHNHEKATSFQSFVIHSYKPVPVYAKKYHYSEEPHNDGAQHDSSHKNHNQEHH